MSPMKMEKSPPELERAFDAAFPDDPRAERRKMFGYAAGFVNGNHFGGLFADQVCLRLGESDRRKLAAEHGAAPFAPMGRPMGGYVSLPQPLVADPNSLREWLRRAFDYGATMPPKAKKEPKANAKPKPRGA